MTKPINKIGVIGLGYVGLTLSLALAKRGYQVYGVEKNRALKKRLRNGKPQFFEEGLERILQTELDNNTFNIFDRIPGECNAYILCVSTPFDRQRSGVDLESLRGATYELLQYLQKGALVINRSTVPIGATRNVVLPILEKDGMRCGTDFHLAYAPERTLEGKAMQELFSNPQIIGGFDEESAGRATDLFRRVTPTIVNVSSLEAAESVKLLDNSYRDVMFSYANQFAAVCEDTGLDAYEIIRAANTHYPRNNIPLPSPGVGGVCLTKDPRILMRSAPESDVGLISLARNFNESIPERMVHQIYTKLKETGGNTKNTRFYLVGFAFKGEPVTDDLRDSTSLWFLQALQCRTSNIVGYDPVVKPEKLTKKGIEMVTDYQKGFRNADAVVVLNNHRSYERWDLKKLCSKMKRPAVVFDSWRKLEFPRSLQSKGIHYMSIGLGN